MTKHVSAWSCRGRKSSNLGRQPDPEGDRTDVRGWRFPVRTMFSRTAVSRSVVFGEKGRKKPFTTDHHGRAHRLLECRSLDLGHGNKIASKDPLRVSR